MSSTRCRLPVRENQYCEREPSMSSKERNGSSEKKCNDRLQRFPAHSHHISPSSQDYFGDEPAAEVREHEHQKTGQRPAHRDTPAPAVEVPAPEQRRKN